MITLNCSLKGNTVAAPELIKKHWLPLEMARNEIEQSNMALFYEEYETGDYGCISTIRDTKGDLWVSVGSMDDCMKKFFA